ncbi:hypothetical protein N7U66_00860 [Lacinutrix neustonica]|uniref:Uncharacterized protein n=1 Tax=Lacinutrix neustonica TaxID=2980107 RepID=A0A9E8MWR9_9FLAO|nr:hypothetical protein [Lacinutrix neustonica]WAC02334.1 hypothetical protein N7U66_00860 [Lacinutrix neustonica]
MYKINNDINAEIIEDFNASKLIDINAKEVLVIHLKRNAIFPNTPPLEILLYSYWKER